MCAWRVASLLPRLAEAGADVTVILLASVAVGPALDLPFRLALGRLAVPPVLLC